MTLNREWCTSHANSKLQSFGKEQSRKEKYREKNAGKDTNPQGVT